MRLQAYFALLLIAQVCSAEDGSLNFQEQVLEKINTLNENVDTLLEKVDTLLELHKQDFQGTILCPNVSTTPLRQWGFRQCLPFCWKTLSSKDCWHPIAVMGVVDTLGLYN